MKNCTCWAASQATLLKIPCGDHVGDFFFLAKAKTHASEIFYPWDPLALKASACFPDPANSPLSLNQPLFLNAPSHSLNPKPQIPNSTFHFHFPFFFFSLYNMPQLHCNISLWACRLFWLTVYLSQPHALLFDCSIFLWRA